MRERLEKIKEEKKQLIAEMKRDAIEEFKEEFVENIEFWKGKMKAINLVISEINSNKIIKNYNEFCKSVEVIVINTMENRINFDSLFLTKKEFKDLEKKYKNSKDNLLLEQKMLELLDVKYRLNLRLVIENRILIDIISKQLKNEKELDVDKVIKLSEGEMERRKTC